VSHTERWVQRNGHRIYVRDYPGQGPAIVLMHGFPDNLHLYDRLVPYLTRAARRVITFDFLGWGASDKPAHYPYTATNQTGDLDAVIDQLDLDSVVLVAHDASGPPAIDWALAHPDRVASLVLLNTYYCAMPTLRPPEAILLYSVPLLRNLARAVTRASGTVDRGLYRWQVGRFIRDPEVRDELVPLLYEQFRSARPAFWELNNDLLGTVLSRTGRIPRMRAFSRPVRIIFGAADPYLNRGVARRFHKLLPTSELHLLPRARHYVQVDEPELVAQLTLSSTAAEPSARA
jgi:pimeloyl-ACP methyl ester carboxylesterase